LYFYNARYYDPYLNRFIQADPVANQEYPQTWNAYAYCLNNPLRYSDPTGYLPDDLIQEYVQSDLNDLPVEVLKMLRALHFGDVLSGTFGKYWAQWFGRAWLDEGKNLTFIDPDTGVATDIHTVITKYKNSEITGFDIYAPYFTDMMNGWSLNQGLFDVRLIYSTKGDAIRAHYSDYDFTMTAMRKFLGFELPMMGLGMLVGEAYAGLQGASKALGLTLGGALNLTTSSIVPIRPGYDTGDRTLTTVYEQGDEKWVQVTIIRGDQIVENKVWSYATYVYEKAKGW